MRTHLIRAVRILAALALLVGGELSGFQGRESSPSPADQGDITAPVPIYTPKPGYPEDMEGPVEGEVLLQVLINAEGIPETVKVVRELYPKLDEQAVKAVKTWRFRPAMKGDVPVAMTATVAVAFKLR